MLYAGVMLLDSEFSWTPSNHSVQPFGMNAELPAHRSRRPVGRCPGPTAIRATLCDGPTEIRRDPGPGSEGLRPERTCGVAW